MKRLTKIITAIAFWGTQLYAANWTGSMSEPENMKKIEDKAFYVITTAEELAWFAAQVNGKKTVNAILAADIMLGSTYAWTPIGKDSSCMFQSIFDGSNYTIASPYTATGNFAGLFGVIGENGVVKNVKVTNPNITHTRNGGTIAGFNNGTIDNIVVTGGSVTTTSDNAFSGGIVGRNNGSISNSKNGSAVSNKNSNKQNRVPYGTRWKQNDAISHAGGISGFNLKKGRLLNNTNNGAVYSYTYYNLAYGGGASAYNEGVILNFTNNGDVTDSSTSFLTESFSDGTNVYRSSLYVGGVAGFNAGSIELSSNTKKVAGLNHSFENICYVGGIAGYNKGNLSKSENIGDVAYIGDEAALNDATNTMFSYVGGIVGYNLMHVSDTKNSGKIEYSAIAIRLPGRSSSPPSNISMTAYSGGIVGVNTGSSAQIHNSFSLSTSVSAYTAKGGIAGQNANSAKIVNTYFDQGVSSGVSTPVGTQSASLTNSSGKSTADMKKDQFAWILNTTNGTEENSGAWTRGTDGYPTFANEDSLAIRKVVFNDDGTTSNRYTNYKGLVTFPENPEPAEGYIFTGWYNANDIKVKPTTVFTADQTVNAVYVDASDVFWAINFYNAAPADTILEAKSYQHGSIVTYGGAAPTLTATAKYTYTFKGWDVEPTNAVEDFDYHAVYDSTIRSYAITFINTDGSKIESATFEYGKMPSCTKTPTRAATAEWTYSHKGWKPALDYVTEETSYTAIYDSSKVEYKVTFMNGTTVIDEQMVPYGDPAVAPTNVTREGYKFVGWNTSFAAVTGALTVKALFEELIIRTVNVVGDDGDKIVDATVEDGGKYILPEAPKKEGYTFDAYYDGDKKLGIAGDEVSVTANITIIARYILRSYVITFNNYDGSKIESASFEYGKMPNCTKTPTRDATAEWAFSHKGWKPALNYVSEDAIYTAIYDSSKVKYKVTFVDGTTVIDEQMVPYGGAAVAPTNVTREGYKFVGWNASFTEVTEALTVMALFEKLIFRTVWVLDGFGGTIEKVKVEDGGKYTLPEAPKKDGYIDDYVFDAYYDGNKKLGVAGDEITITASITITAKYIKNPESSSSVAKSSSSSKEIASSSSQNSAKSSSSTKINSSSSSIKSSSSEKTDAIIATKAPLFSVHIVARNLQISGAKIGAAYALFDMQGKVLLQGRTQTANFDLSIARPGNYLLKIGNATQKISVK